jgi:hypothetical protein
MFENLKKSIEMAEAEHSKFKGGNKAACTRCRAHLMQIKKECDVVRVRCMADKKAMPVKVKVKAKSIKTPTKE